MSELKPCPFCGGDPVLHERASVGWYVECSDCFSGTGNQSSARYAIEAWNTRAERTCSLTYEGVDESWQGEELYPVDTVRCTACGSLVYDVNAMNYCPHCGARVVGD